MTMTVIDLEGALCPICRNHIEAAPRLCGQCLTAYHRDCWDYNAGCAIFACANAPAHKGPAPVENLLVRRQEGWARLVASAAAGFCLALAVLAPRIAWLGPVLGSHLSGGYSLSWTTSDGVPCYVTVYSDPSMSTLVTAGVTRKARSHRFTLSPSQLSRGRFYRVQALSQGFQPDDVTVGTLPPGDPISPAPGAVGTSVEESEEPGHSSPAFHGLKEALSGVADLDSTHVYIASFDSRFFGGFNLQWDSPARTARMTWRTQIPVRCCRIVLSRDASLKGVEKVVEALTISSGLDHSAVVRDLAPGASYCALVLAAPATGDLVQSPVVRFTLPSR